MKKSEYKTLPTNKGIGERIKNARTTKKITQKVFAEACFMREKRLRAIEKGEISPSLEEINNIANALQMDAISFIVPQMDEFKTAKVSGLEKMFEEKIGQIEEEFKHMQEQTEKSIKELHDIKSHFITSLKF